MKNKAAIQRSGSPGTPSTQSMFSNFEFDQLSAEERLYLHAARMGDMILLNEVIETSDNNKLNWNCVDYMGRNALHLAVDSENIDMIETLIEKVSFECLEEGLLHAISKGLLNIVRLIIDHPKYLSEEAQQLKVIGKKDAFFRKEEKYQYPPDITPLILAAHHNDHEIIQLFISRGYTIDRPHVIHCQCQDCRSKQQCDSLKRSRSRLHAYKALASPAYLALSSQDPITESFELRKELIQIAHIEKEFKKDYLQLVEQCMEFTCTTMCLCRGTQEMEAILGQASELHGPLARLRLAVYNEEKMFVAHPNTQQHLTNLWYGEEMQFIQAWAMWKKVVLLLVCPIAIPLFCVSYILCPNTWIGRAMRCPISKFMTHTLSHLTFLLLLAAATFGLEERLGGIHEPDIGNEGTHLEIFTPEGRDALLRRNFRPARDLFGSIITYGQALIAFWVIGNLCLECKQIYNSSPKEHFRQYYNIMDFLILAFYIASYTLRFLIYFRLQEAERELHYVKDARNALEERNYTAFTIIVNHARAERQTTINNYFMQTSRFQWECYDPEIVANVLFAFANVLSFARTTYLMPFHELLGPLQISLGRMMTDIVRFTVLFMLVLLAFMVGMTNLYTYYSHDSNSRRPGENSKVIESFEGLWQTVNTLFFSMFGLITLDKLKIKMPEDITVANPDSTLLVHRVGQFLFAMFQVLVTIVLVNMLIAMMSHSFEAVQDDTDVEWKFARTKLWLNFIDEESTLPVPFNIIPTWKTAKYIILWFKHLISKSDDDISLHKYDFSRRRENVVLEGLERSGLVFSKSTYTDIIQRIMRRYLFKMDREKVEKEKREGVLLGEVCGINEDKSSNDNDHSEGEEKSSTKECNVIFEEEGDNLLQLPPLPPVRDLQASRSTRLRNKPENGEAFRQSTRRSTMVRRGKDSVKFSSLSSLQLDAIQRGQRLLDARMQDLVANRAEYEVMKKNMNVIRQIIVQNHQDLASLLEVMRGMSSDITTLGQAFNQFVGFKLRKEKKKATRTAPPCSPNAQSDGQMSYQLPDMERLEATAAATLDAATSTGSRSNSSPGVMCSPEMSNERGRSSRLSSIKKRLSIRKSHPPINISHV